MNTGVPFPSPVTLDPVPAECAGAEENIVRTAMLARAFLLAALFAPASVAQALETPPSYWFDIQNTGRVSQMDQTPDGKILAPSMDQHRVLVFAADGSFIASFGSSGTALGQFNTPSGVTIDEDGNIYVCDQFNHRVQKFPPTFIPLLGMGGSGTGPGELQYPTNCVLSPDESILYVTELLNHHFNLVVGLDLDMDGVLWATDQLNNRMKKITQSGTVLAVWGIFGAGPNQFYNPWSVFVTNAGSIWVGDTYNYRIEVFRYFPTVAEQTSWGSVKTRYR